MRQWLAQWARRHSMEAAFTGKYDFGLGSVMAMRKFEILPDGTLDSVAYHYKWTEGVNVCSCWMRYAEDLNEKTHPNDPLPSFERNGKCSDPDHTCGFWAYYNRKVYPSGDIDGVIEGSGRTTIGTKGVRVEKAEIKGLVIPRYSLWARVCDLFQGHWLRGIVILWASVALSWPPYPEPFATLANIVWMAVQALYLLTIPGYYLGGKVVDPDKVEKIKAKYPNVPHYRSRRAIRKAFPLTAKPGRGE